MKISTTAQGRRSELKVTEKLISLGYSVFEAVYPDSCDCIVRTKQGLKQIQIKTLSTAVKQPLPGVNLRRSKGILYQKDTVDFFIVTHPDNNDFWIVPFLDGNKHFNFHELTGFLNKWDSIPKPFENS